jgi:hypothetical protein
MTVGPGDYTENNGYRNNDKVDDIESVNDVDIIQPSSDTGGSSNSNDSNQNTSSPNYNNNKKGVTLAIADNFGMNDSEDNNKNDKNDNNNDDNLNDKKPGTKGQNLVTDAIANTITNGGK